MSVNSPMNAVIEMAPMAHMPATIPESLDSMFSFSKSSESSDLPSFACDGMKVRCADVSSLACGRSSDVASLGLVDAE